MDVGLSLFAGMYPYTQVVVLFVMAIWYLYDLKNRLPIWVKIGLLISVILYFASFFANYEFQTFMVVWFLRDVVTYLLGVKVLDFLLKYKWLTLLVLLSAGVGFGIYVQKYGNPLDNQNTNDVSSFNQDSEFLVEFNSPERANEFRQKFKQHNITLEPAFPQLKDPEITDLDNFYVLDFVDVQNASAEKIAELTQDVERLGIVSYLEYNDPIQVWPDAATSQGGSGKSTKFSEINDELAEKQWALRTVEADKLSGTLKAATPVKKARIFVLDTGIEAKHPDLAANYQSFNHKFDRDTQQHGTHCAGIASAVSNNKLGIASLNLTNQYATITGITVLPKGHGTQESVIDGIIDAADNDADVISMSLGGPKVESSQRAYEKAIRYANRKGAIVVVAAGNDGRSASYSVPASCSGVIVVSATDEQNRLAKFSNTLEAQTYRLAAPGANILSTVPGGYDSFNGTSMATPLVAGLVGILKSLKPDLETSEIWQILHDTGLEVSAESSKRSGRIIQPTQAIQYLFQKEPIPWWRLIWDWFLSFLRRVFQY